MCKIENPNFVVASVWRVFRVVANRRQPSKRKGRERGGGGHEFDESREKSGTGGMIPTGPVTGLCIEVSAWIKDALDGFSVASITESRPCCVGAEASTQKHMKYIVSPTRDATPTEIRRFWSHEGDGMPTICKISYGHYFDEISGRLEMLVRRLVPELLPDLSGKAWYRCGLNVVRAAYILTITFVSGHLAI